MKYTSRLVIMLLAAALSVTSCRFFGHDKAPSTEFATFIKAYTGGVISDKSAIRIELTSDIAEVQEGTLAKEDLFAFSPAIRGGARWLSSNMIEFVPEPGALKAGQTYRCTFRLDKLMKIGDRKLRRFPFRFMVATKEVSMTVGDIVIPASDPDEARVEGTIAVSDDIDIEQVKDMFSVSYPSDSSYVDITDGQDHLHFNFVVGGLKRSDKDQTLKMSLKTGSTGFKAKDAKEVTVPGKGSFRIIKTKMSEGQDPYIEVLFSEPLADLADEDGLLTLSNIGRSYIQIQDNIAKIFYEGKYDGLMQLYVSDAIKSIGGAKLESEYSEKFNPDKLKPAVEIPLAGSILPDTRQLILPFRAVSLKAVDLRIVKIYEDNVLSFLQDNDLDGGQGIRRSGRLVYKRCIRLDSDPSKDLHKWQDFSVDLSGLFKREPGAIYRIRLSFKQDYSVYGVDDIPGSRSRTDEMLDISSGDMTEEDIAVWDTPSPYFYDGDYDWSQYSWKDKDNPLKASYYMEDDRFPEKNLMTSDLGVTAKYSGGDVIWLSASDILSSKPLYGVDFEIYNYQLRIIGKGRTDSNGLEEIKLSGKPFAVVARRNGATTYLKVTDGSEKSLSRFDVGGTELVKGLKSFIYGERGVWRPGDTLHVTMILDDKQHDIPDRHPASMELYTPQGQFYTKQICGQAVNGFYTYAVPTSADDPTGIWNAYFKVGGATFHKSLRIETVKPNRLKINIDMNDKILSAGETDKMKISSNWLTGPAASFLAAKAEMTLSSGGSFFEGFEGYNFSNPAVSFSSSEHKLFSTTLDSEGKAIVSVEMPQASEAPGMLKADIICSVEEQGGDASFTTMTVPFSPFSAYVGVKVPGTEDGKWLETDKDNPVKIAVVDKNGKRVSGDDLEYRIFKLDWSWWWESRAEDLDSYVNGNGAEAIEAGRFTSTSSDYNLNFRIDYPEWGRYLIYVKDLTSGHASGEIVSVDWPASRGRSGKNDPDALTMLSFTTDKKSYEVGETATVYIPGAATGRAMVSLENSSTILSREWVKTEENGNTEYKFKITPQMAPNFYVHITLLQPYEKTVNDLPVRMYGVQPVLVNDKATHLEPVINMAESVHPEEPFTIKIKEKTGKPMTYTLAIVDDGLLDLTSFMTPDPWKVMYAREALGVKTWDIFDDVIGAYSGRFAPMFSVGGDESILVRPKKENRFNPVVRFMGPFTLTAGTGTHTVKLPMYVGSVRVMVVAGKDGAFGNAEKTVTVKSPLMVLPSLPRVIGTGEEVTLPVNVFAMEDGVKNAEISVKTEGPIKIDGASKATVTFDKPGDQLVRFTLKSEGEGTAKVTVTATGGGHKASQTITVPVRNPAPETSKVTTMTLKKGEAKELDVHDGAAVLELSSFPAINFDACFSFMDNYAYTCTEQIASKGLTLLHTLDLLSESNAQKARKMIPDILQELYSRQLADGGFAYWPGMTHADEWASSMVGEFMSEAAGKGFDVSKGVVASWQKFQSTGAKNYRHSDSRFLNDLSQAYRLYTMAVAGAPDNASMNRLKESQGLSSQARYMLAAAYSVCGKKNISTDILTLTSSEFKEYQADNLSFGSSLRDKSIAMLALTLSDELPEAIELSEQIAESFSKEMYSTQEAAFAAIAMGSLAEKTGTDGIDATLSYDDKCEAVKTAKSTWTKALLDKSELKNNSDGVLFATMITTAKAAPGQKTAATSNGLKISVRYIGEDGSTMNPAMLKQGTDFTAEINVANPSLSNDYTGMALSEIIPSGWEISNDRLYTAAVQNSYTWKDVRDDRTIWYFDLPRGTSKTFKTRLRAAYEGKFTLPSVTCEAMYNAKVNAATASGEATVTR